MSARKPPAKQYGSKPMSKQYRDTMAFMAATFRDDKPLTDEDRDELIRKAVK